MSFRLRKGEKGYSVKQKKENVLRERKFVKECSTEIEAGDKVKTSRGFCQSRLSDLDSHSKCSFFPPHSQSAAAQPPFVRKEREGFCTSRGEKRKERERSGGRSGNTLNQ